MPAFPCTTTSCRDDRDAGPLIVLSCTYKLPNTTEQGFHRVRKASLLYTVVRSKGWAAAAIPATLQLLHLFLRFPGLHLPDGCRPLSLVVQEKVVFNLVSPGLKVLASLLQQSTKWDQQRNCAILMVFESVHFTLQDRFHAETFRGNSHWVI